MTAGYDFATGKVPLPEVSGVSHSVLWLVGFEMAKSVNHMDGTTWLSVETICKRTGLSERTVQRARAELVKAGVFLPVVVPHKSATFTPGWVVSPRKKIAKAGVVQKVDGISRALMTMMSTLVANGVSVDRLRNLCRVTERTIRTWKNHAQKRKYMAEVHGTRTKTLLPTGESKEVPSLSERSNRAQARSTSLGARSKRLERMRRAMPYDLFKNSPQYTADSDSLTNAAIKAARKKPASRKDKDVSEWTIRDAIQEFRDKYRDKYPTHSPDELGNVITLSKILGKQRKAGVSVMHMVSAIDTFFKEGLDRTHASYPAWQKWLWKVRDTRPSDEAVFRSEKDSVSGDAETPHNVKRITSKHDNMLASLARAKDERFTRLTRLTETLARDEEQYGRFFDKSGKPRKESKLSSSDQIELKNNPDLHQTILTRLEFDREEIARAKADIAAGDNWFPTDNPVLSSYFKTIPEFSRFFKDGKN